MHDFADYYDPMLPVVEAPSKPFRPSPFSPVIVSRYSDVMTLLRHKEVDVSDSMEAVETMLKRVGKNPEALVRLSSLTSVLAKNENHAQMRSMSRDIFEPLFTSWTNDKLARISREFLKGASTSPACNVHEAISIAITQGFILNELNVSTETFNTMNELAYRFIQATLLMDKRLPDIIENSYYAETFINDMGPLLSQAKILKKINTNGMNPIDVGLLFGLNANPIITFLSTCLTFSMVCLSKEPALKYQLQQKPEQINRFIHECFRLANGLRWTTHSITQTDIMLCDALLPKRTVFTCDLQRANYDPDIFLKPHLICLSLNRKQSHIAFGAGAHICLGGAFSWRVMKSFLTVLLNEFEITHHADPVEAEDPIRRVYVEAMMKIRYCK
ncbi:MAG TPA: cytochrome P450 [Methyloprofundus sp.]|uniref:cytochrome P450 n=1 Tax=Methyloprofundus sp. TaxID=2020875 RepID=UPI00183B3A9E|nr:cytochrome P450 [Methyloprofundus sp.]HIG66069.1 cytochrome P450 [Methyloprofundus sp.]HIL78824.1 cytochrome P450 [Methylococcales bacterium]